MVLNDIQKEVISKYLESRLGQYGIHWFDFAWSVTPTKTYKELATHNIELKNCGILRYMLKSCLLEVRVWHNKEDIPFLADVSFSYEHTNGGSNGHDTSIRLIISGDKVYEEAQ